MEISIRATPPNYRFFYGVEKNFYRAEKTGESDVPPIPSREISGSGIPVSDP
jgi:hypothetical protein